MTPDHWLSGMDFLLQWVLILGNKNTDRSRFQENYLKQAPKESINILNMLFCKHKFVVSALWHAFRTDQPACIMKKIDIEERR